MPAATSLSPATDETLARHAAQEDAEQEELDEGDGAAGVEGGVQVPAAGHEERG